MTEIGTIPWALLSAIFCSEQIALFSSLFYGQTQPQRVPFNIIFRILPQNHLEVAFKVRKAKYC